MQKLDAEAYWDFQTTENCSNRCLLFLDEFSAMLNNIIQGQVTPTMKKPVMTRVNVTINKAAFITQRWKSKSKIT